MADTIIVTQASSFARNKERCKGHEQPCVICGKPCRNPRYLMEFVGGGLTTAAMPGTADVSDPGYMGSYPIGADCLRANPQFKPFATDIGREAAQS